MTKFMSVSAAMVAAGLFAFSAAARADEFSAAVPEAFHFGEGLAAHDFETACESYNVRELALEDMPIAQESHVQVDCEGFAWGGAGRFTEFVFVDGALTHVWVMTEVEDLSAMRAAFEGAYGTPSHDIEGAVTAWIPAGAAVRYDVPEALFMAESVAPLFAAWFDSFEG